MATGQARSRDRRSRHHRNNDAVTPRRPHFRKASFNGLGPNSPDGPQADTHTEIRCGLPLTTVTRPSRFAIRHLMGGYACRREVGRGGASGDECREVVQTRQH
jgi:hypothetical protein